ncbi:hypothetical protein EVAR_39363_1 [Eumeta japonica]|uniref:Uncharacterized protein n=1 Tax=Eumeta variegata TaxID=151549 RepID=A0A4C1WRS1_EUMVA|nr:hypothetical protein EVAR_39363_1 [Eumeta japonica]
MQLIVETAPEFCAYSKGRGNARNVTRQRRDARSYRDADSVVRRRPHTGRAGESSRTSVGRSAAFEERSVMSFGVYECGLYRDFKFRVLASITLKLAMKLRS